jgi:hypothetical protein
MARVNERATRFPGVLLSENDIEEILRRGVQSKILDFSGANLSGEQPLFIADIILSSKLLDFTHINISSTQISTKGFEAILNAAYELKSLESFIARDNNLSKDVGLALSKLIGTRGLLRVLDVSNNQLGDVGVAAIAGIFGMIQPPSPDQSFRSESISLYTLVTLDISNNNFGDMGVLALCRGLTQFAKNVAANNTRMNGSGSRGFSFGNDAYAGGAAGGGVSLKVLKMNQNKLSDKAALCLAQLINTKLTGNGSPDPRTTPLQQQPSQLQLEELWLNDNPSLTSRGLLALLGSVSEGVTSPLVKLCVSRCRPTTAVLDQLAVNIRSGSRRPRSNDDDYHNGDVAAGGYTCRLEHVELSFTQAVADEAIRESALKFNKIENNYSGYVCLSTAVAKLSDAVLCTDTIKRIDLGSLPRCIYNSCVSAVQGKQVAQYQDTIKSLDCLNNAAAVFGLQYISHIKGWVTDTVYENRHYYAPHPPRRLVRSEYDEQPPMVVQPAAAKTTVVTTTTKSVSDTSSSSSSSVSKSVAVTSGGSAALAAVAALKSSMERVLPPSSQPDGGRSSFLSNLQSQLSPQHPDVLSGTVARPPEFTHNPNDARDKSAGAKNVTKSPEVTEVKKSQKLPPPRGNAKFPNNLQSPGSFRRVASEKNVSPSIGTRKASDNKLLTPATPLLNQSSASSNSNNNLGSNGISAAPVSEAEQEEKGLKKMFSTQDLLMSDLIDIQHHHNHKSTPIVPTETVIQPIQREEVRIQTPVPTEMTSTTAVAPAPLSVVVPAPVPLVQKEPSVVSTVQGDLSPNQQRFLDRLHGKQPPPVQKEASPVIIAAAPALQLLPVESTPPPASKIHRVSSGDATPGTMLLELKEQEYLQMRKDRSVRITEHILPYISHYYSRHINLAQCN